MSFSENRNRHRKIFKSLKNCSKYNYTNKQIAEWTGFDSSKISRFLNGKRDLEAGEFLYLLKCMPERFQQEYWRVFNPIRNRKSDLEALIIEMDKGNLTAFLNVIARALKRKNEGKG